MRPVSFGARYGGAALVTGASSGIGAAFAEVFAAGGTDVILVARRGERLAALSAALEARHGVRAPALALDLTTPGAAGRCQSFAAECRLEVGILVNNAGFGVPGRFVELDATQNERMVDLHCRVPVALCHAFVPAMAARRRGAVIFVSSLAAYQPTPSTATYGASKAFELHFGESLWGELRPLGLDVLVLSPGYTRTEFHATAGVVHDRLPGWMWSAAEDVVRTGLAALGRTPSVVHGRRNALQSTVVRLLPRAVAVRVANWALTGWLRKRLREEQRHG